MSVLFKISPLDQPNEKYIMKVRHHTELFKTEIKNHVFQSGLYGDDNEILKKMNDACKQKLSSSSIEKMVASVNELIESQQNSKSLMELPEASMFLTDVGERKERIDNTILNLGILNTILEKYRTDPNAATYASFEKYIDKYKKDRTLFGSIAGLNEDIIPKIFNYGQLWAGKRSDVLVGYYVTVKEYDTTLPKMPEKILEHLLLILKEMQKRNYIMPDLKYANIGFENNEVRLIDHDEETLLYLGETKEGKTADNLFEKAKKYEYLTVPFAYTYLPYFIKKAFDNFIEEDVPKTFVRNYEKYSGIPYYPREKKQDCLVYEAYRRINAIHVVEIICKLFYAECPRIFDSQGKTICSPNVSGYYGCYYKEFYMDNNNVQYLPKWVARTDITPNSNVIKFIKNIIPIRYYLSRYRTSREHPLTDPNSWLSKMNSSHKCLMSMNFKNVPLFDEMYDDYVKILKSEDDVSEIINKYGFVGNEPPPKSDARSSKYKYMKYKNKYLNLKHKTHLL